MPFIRHKTKGRSPYEMFGWHENPEAVNQVLSTLAYPVFGVAAHAIQGSGAGKTILLHEVVKEVLGYFPIHLQTIGDCVSHGWGLGIDVHKCVRIALQGENEEFRGQTATEIIYAGSRVEIGGGQIAGDGSIGAWAAKFVTQYGTLVRGKYGNLDLTTYNGNTAKSMGRRGAGVPDSLEPQVREHPVHTTSLVRSYEEARDAIANGYPVPVCSNRGFQMKRDADGFARPSGSWPHCMCFVSVDDTARRPGLLCCNSWGEDWISGPTRLNQPAGSFWVDAEVADAMLSGRGMGGADSFSISGFTGYPGLVDKLSHKFFW